MLIDQHIANGRLARTARHPGVDILLDAWLDTPADTRAAMALAAGDLPTAAGYGDGWQRLAERDFVGALGIARKGPDAGTAPMRLLEAEALIEAGGIVAGLERLKPLHDAGDPASTLALARHRYRLGDHRGAEAVARALPMHTGTALVGARAALMEDNPASAFAFLEPFLTGSAPLPEPMTAGAVAVLAASAMVRGGLDRRLKRFAGKLIGAPCLPDEMMPTVARVAWTAGMSAAARERFSGNAPWMAAARLELAMLAGDAALATQLMARAGAAGAPAAAAAMLLRGGDDGPSRPDLAERTFAAGASVHVWRTHPHRWQPWIDAALGTEAEVGVFDLAGGQLPEAGDIPRAVFDDGSLMDVLEPVPVTARECVDGPLWIDGPLCRGIALGLDWPDEETRAIREAAPQAAGPEDAAVLVVGGDGAFERACGGRPTVAVAPPGDPFWAGPLPERVWPSVRVVRADAREGWGGAGERIVAAARSLTGQAD